MKLKKRIAAIGAAVMMMSTMAIGLVPQIAFLSTFPTLALLPQKSLVREMQHKMTTLKLTTELIILQMQRQFLIAQPLADHM